MPQRRPIGIFFLGGFFTFIGAVATLILILDIVDALRFYGPSSLSIETPTALMGFLIYGGAPLSFYLTGMGFFTAKPWARKLALFVNPVLIFLYAFVWASRMAGKKSGILHGNPLNIMMSNALVFGQIMMAAIVLIVFLIIYLNTPRVRNYFNSPS